MTFFNLFVLIFAAVVLGMGTLHMFRPALITLVAVAAMQAIIIANTYLYYDTLPTTSGTFTARAKVTTAGAIIKAVGLLLMAGFLGYRDESSTVFEPPAKKEQMRGGYLMAQEPVGPPPGTNPLEAEAQTIGVRPGRVYEGTHGGAPTTTTTHTTSTMPV